MRRIISFIFLFSLALSACNAGASTPVTTNQRTAETAPEAPTTPPTITLIPQLAPTSTLVLPTPTQSVVEATAYPTSTPLPAPQTLPSNEIKFGAGGTWKDTRDSVGEGQTKIYKLTARQGQVMSVSVTGGYFPLEIRGLDGTTLCPVEADRECSFWRGTLPLTQPYYIIVKSGGMGTDFTLRVAVNPPGRSQQFFAYTEPASGLTLSYPDLFAPADTPTTFNNKTDIRLALQWINTESYVNTNLGEAYFALGSSTDTQIVSSCTEPNQTGGAPEFPNGSIAVNGHNFTYSTASGVGAGNIYDQHIYRIAKSGVCYEIIFFIHSSNIGNYTPGAVKEFDVQGLMQSMNEVFSTIQIQ